MSRQVIVGMDPFRTDEEPIALGALLGRATGAPLLIVGVYPDATTGLTLGAAERDRAAKEHALEGIDRVLRNLGAGDGEIHGARFRTMAVSGSSPAHALHDVASREQPALLVVGSTHRGAIGRIVPGSVTERVVHGSPCPVAVAPRGFDDLGRGFKRVGVAYAGTAEGQSALESAVTLAANGDARLIAYTVVDPLAHPTGYATFPPMVAEAEELKRRAGLAEAQLKHKLAEVAPGMDTEAVIIGDGNIDELVTRTADLDLLICGSRGYGPLSAVLLGSVTHTLMRKSACPLVLIPRGVPNAFTPLLSSEAVAQ